jgi:hypothetical protein
MNEKVWVVTHTQGSQVVDSSVFDNKADANNYAEEMGAGGKGSYCVTESVLNTRAATDAEHLVEMPEFDNSCIECLVDEYQIDHDKFDAGKAAAYLAQHKTEIKEKADSMVKDYIKKELHDYLLGERVILG